jgi:hypothetical protein
VTWALLEFEKSWKIHHLLQEEEEEEKSNFSMKLEFEKHLIPKEGIHFHKGTLLCLDKPFINFTLSKSRPAALLTTVESFTGIAVLRSESEYLSTTQLLLNYRMDFSFKVK